MAAADPTDDGVRCMLMRGGTSKGAYFLAGDVPADPHARDDLMLRVMGSPDSAQIDGLGGAHPLTSKVAIVSLSDEPDVDVDYLFLQVGVDQPTVERRADMRQSARRHRALRRRARSRDAGRRGDDGAHPAHQHRRPRDRDLRDAGRSGRLRRRHRDRRRARHGGADRHRDDRRLAGATPAHRPGCRRARRPPRDADRQRDAGRAAARRRVRSQGRREPGRARGARRCEGCRGARPPPGRAPDGARRRVRRHRSEDVPAVCPAQRRRDLDPRVHPGSRAHVHRRPDGGIRRRRHPHPGRRRVRHRDPVR